MDETGDTSSLSLSRRQGASDEVSCWEAGSFRDPGGSVFSLDGKVYRAIHRRSWEDWTAFSSSPLYTQLQEEGLLISTQPVSVGSHLPREVVEASAAIVEHKRVPFVSYPYEWSFEMLKDAALLHLDILERSLSHGLILKDSSTFNVQFVGAKPIFIDILSFARLEPGESWIGYNQFCKMFLYPLMLQAYKQVPFQNWLRGELEGLDPVTFSRLMSTRDLLRPGVFTHVSLQAWMQKRMAAARYSVRSKIKTAAFPKSAIANNVYRLRRLIHRLDVNNGNSVWADYTQTHSYSDASMQQKEDFVRQVVAKPRRRLVWDLGCNVGLFSRMTAERSDYVIAMDADHASVDTLYRNLKREGCRNILPLVMNLANLSPNQGWAGRERMSLPDRGRPDLALCLALIHHIRFSANIPVASFIAWLVALGACIVIEFVSKEDPMVQQLLLNKDDTYDDYERGHFENCLNQHFHVRNSIALAGGTRFLYYAVPRSQKAA